MKQHNIKKYNYKLYESIILYLLIIIILIISTYFIHKYYRNNSIKEGLVFNYLPLKNALNEKGIIVNKNTNTLDYNGQSLVYTGNMNTDENRKAANSKDQMSKMLRMYNIPVPEYYPWNSKLSNSENIKALYFSIPNGPYVVKPINGIQGNDVYIGLKTSDDILDKVNRLQKLKKYRGIIIEKMLIGNTYRVLIIENEVVDVVKIHLPIVTGNGQKTLQTLVNEYNTNNLRKGVTKLKKVNIDYVKEQGVDNMQTIIPNGKHITLTRVANATNGSKLARISINTISPINIALFKKVHNISKLRISGVDYIGNDIRYGKLYVLDINPGPGHRTHMNGFDKQERTSIMQKIATHIKRMFK